VTSQSPNPAAIRYLIVADGDFGPMTSKTANAIVRYQADRVVAVMDRRLAGRILGASIGGSTDVMAPAFVAKLRAAP